VYLLDIPVDVFLLQNIRFTATEYRLRLLNRFGANFSSPEHKVLMVNYCDWPCPLSSLIFTLNILSETVHWMLIEKKAWIIPFSNCAQAFHELHNEVTVPKEEIYVEN